MRDPRPGWRRAALPLLGLPVWLVLALPLVALLPYGAASGRLPAAGVLLLLAIAGFFIPDLMLRSEVKRRREEIFLDLPEAIAVLALALGAGQSLRQALELVQGLNAPPAGELARFAACLQRAQAAFTAGEHHRLFRGELIEELPEGLRRWLVENGHLDRERAGLGMEVPKPGRVPGA